MQCHRVLPNGMRCQVRSGVFDALGCCYHPQCVAFEQHHANDSHPAGLVMKLANYTEGFYVSYDDVRVNDKDRYPAPGTEPKLGPGRELDPSPAWRRLIEAVKHGDLMRIRHAIADGANVNAEEANVPQASPCFYAAARNDVEALRVLIEHGARPEFSCDTTLSDPINWAATAGAADAVAVLLEHYRNVQCFQGGGNDLSYTALFCAASNGHADVCRLLIAAFGRSFRMNQFSMARSARDAYIRSCEENGVEVDATHVRYIMDVQNKDGTLYIDFANDDGERPIDIAAQRNFSRTVGLLVRSGASVRLHAEGEIAGLKLPEERAMERGHCEIASFLTAVRKAGGYARYCAEPRLALVILRCLTHQRRASLATALDNVDSNTREAEQLNRFIFWEAPDLVFVTVLRLWWG